ncbi:MAG: LptF/LptG family permease, partial [Paracoccaceae bacterium]|nr:LptF/LptG family permease [Paracoccaceae bacterium]
MSKFDKYLLSQLLAIFGFFSLSIIGIYWINLSVSLFEQVVGSGNTLGLFLELSFLSLPNLTATVLPIAAFIGTIYVINRFVRESELLVMQSIGMSAFQIAKPV